MGLILLGVGMVLTIEGLALALAPSRIEEVLEMLRRMPVETRRILGLGALGLGITVIWLAERLLG